MIHYLDQPTGLIWTPTAHGPQTLRCLFLGSGSVPAGWVSLAPGANTILVRLTRADGTRFGTCLDTTNWRTQWSIPIPVFEGRDVGCRFLTADRFVIATREVSLWQ